MQPSSVPAMNAPHAHSPKWVPGPESSGAGRDLDTPSGTPPAVLRSGRVRLHWKLLCARTLDSTAELTAQKLRPAGGARARAQRDSESPRKTGAQPAACRTSHARLLQRASRSMSPSRAAHFAQRGLTRRACVPATAAVAYSQAWRGARRMPTHARHAGAV